MWNSTVVLQSHNTPSSIHHKPSICKGCVCAIAEFFSTAPLKIFSRLILSIIDLVVSLARHDSLFRPAAVENIKIIFKTILFMYNPHSNYNVNIY